MEIREAFILLGIGMFTVFLVLFLVVQTGNLLIRVVNRWSPAEEPVMPQRRKVPLPAVPAAGEGAEAALLAAVVAAVEVVTQRQGQVVSVRKIQSKE